MMRRAIEESLSLSSGTVRSPLEGMQQHYQPHQYISPAVHAFSGRLTAASRRSAPHGAGGYYNNSNPYANLQGENIDPDAMSYEELLALGERIGDVNVGMGVAQFNRIPTNLYAKKRQQQQQLGGGGAKDDDEDEECAICKDVFQNGDETILLPCVHRFHRDCLRNWFSQKTNCPICKADCGRL